MGGLRVYVNLLVDYAVLCEVYPLKRNSCNEMDSVRLQARRIRELEGYIDAQNGGPGKGWLRIVRDPFEARRVINKGKLATIAAVKEAQEVLNSGQSVFGAGLDREPLRELFLLTAKPFIFVFNCDSDELADDDLKAELRTLVSPAEAIFLDAKIESELVEMEPDEARELLAEMDIAEPGLDVLARVGFATLGLQTYLTAGPKESRAWTIPKGATAPEAAGVIHTDFQKGFIKAEVVSFEDLVEAGSMQVAKARGKVRLEGKDYVMADGDVVEFRFGSTSTSKG